MQVWLTVRQAAHTRRHPTEAGQVSLLSLGLMAGVDAFLCLLHLTTALVVPQMAVSLSAAALVQFISCSVVGIHHIMDTQRAQRHSFRRWGPSLDLALPSLCVLFFSLLGLGG